MPQSLKSPLMGDYSLLDLQFECEPLVVGVAPFAPSPCHFRNLSILGDHPYFDFACSDFAATLTVGFPGAHRQAGFVQLLGVD